MDNARGETRTGAASHGARPTRGGLGVWLGLLMLGLVSIRPTPGLAAPWLAAEEASSLYLPGVLNGREPPRVNVPHFPVADVIAERFDEMAIFWFGRVTPSVNYADVRIGYSDTALELRLGIIDRLLWFDAAPAPGDLEAWDAVTVYLDLDGRPNPLPQPEVYRFVAQLSWLQDNRESWQAAYRGTGTGWESVPVPFTTLGRWRGDAPNNALDDRGWEARFRIPFTSLGLAGAPPQGTTWGLSVVVHDRDEGAGAPLPLQHWPEDTSPAQRLAAGELHFGPQTYSAPPAQATQLVTIREGLAGAEVPDAAVGGTVENLCPGNAFHIWNQWGERAYGSSRALAVQNQRDIADWPCFAKAFVQFPLNQVPDGREIISATLTLHHWANSGVPTPGQPNTAGPSFVHVLTVPSGWDEATLGWNNDPQPMENVAQAWVPVAAGCVSPCFPRSWDVSYAVARAYAAGGSISFALYSSDGAYHSGKFFSASDTASWEAVARPTLTIVWAEP